MRYSRLSRRCDSGTSISDALASRAGRTSRRILALGGVLAVMIGFAAPGAMASSSSTRERALIPSACSTSALVVWLDTAGSGAAGSVYFHLEFTNAGTRSCSLFGYPGVAAVTLSGLQLGAPANKNVTAAPKTITLGVGATGTATLQITDSGVYSRAACHPISAAGLRVYPPGQKAAKVVPYPFTTCSVPARVTLHIGAMIPGVLPR